MSTLSKFVPNRLRFNAFHYDAITEAWKHIFGSNFHFGYFATPNISLEEATDALIDRMASLGNLSERTKVLDVGCGIGSPAFYLHGKYGCDITGISTSEVGIGDAKTESQRRGYQDYVRFRVANGLDNGFDSETFDVVWVMESSHLVRDKKKLLGECFRVLKPGGVLLLCDVMLRRPFTIADHLGFFRRMGIDYITANVDFFRSFGWIRIEPFETYTTVARAVGFNDITFIDISDETIPTLKWWKDNITAKKESIAQTLTPGQIKGFLVSSDLAKDSLERKIGGYGILSARRKTSA
jgi:27-O-demethylrifamycin SV methyltransferase